MLRPHLSSRSIKTFSELLFLHDTDADQAGDAKEQQSDQQCDEGHDACIDGRHGVQHRQKVNTDEFQSVRSQPADDKQKDDAASFSAEFKLEWKHQGEDNKHHGQD